MEPDMAYPWHTNVYSIWGLKRIGKRDTGELVPLAFKPGLFGQLLIAAMPGRVGVIQHALQRMAGDAELCAVVCKQIVKGFSGVRDTIITQLERCRVLRTRGGLTPYLKRGGCAAVLLTRLTICVVKDSTVQPLFPPSALLVGRDSYGVSGLALVKGAA